jgi:hypothetical protein
MIQNDLQGRKEDQESPSISSLSIDKDRLSVGNT